MANEEVVIRVVMEDAATGAGGTGTPTGPSGSWAQQAKQVISVQSALLKAQAGVAAAQARVGSAQAQRDAARYRSDLAAVNLDMARMKAAAQPALLKAQTVAAQAKAQAAQTSAQMAQVRAASAQKSWFDNLFDIVDKLRGTLGGIFGTLTGGVLDLWSATRKGKAKSPLATAAQMAAAAMPMVFGQATPQAPPGMTWETPPQAPLPAGAPLRGGIGPTNAPQPFQPGTLAPQPIYKVPPFKGTEPVIGEEPFPGFGRKTSMAGLAPKPGVLAGGSPGTSPLAGMGGGGAAAGGLAILKFVVAAGYKIKDSFNAAADATGKFASTMVSAEAAPATFVSDISRTTRSLGDSMGIFGALISNVGALGEALGSVMGQINQMGQRYGAVNPQIATAQAMADINQTLNDFRRGQEAAPDLVNFINQQSQLQQKIEETKISILKKIMPAVLTGMDIFEKKVLPLLEVIFEGLSLIARAIGAGSREVRSGLADLELAGLRAPDPVNLPSRDVRDRNFRDVFTQRGREGAG